MRIVHVMRRPLAGTVAQTVLKWGTGGLNIDRSRIEGVLHPQEERHSKTGFGIWNQGSRRAKEEGEPRHNPFGRFPANLILSHLPGCRRVGFREVPSSGGTLDKGGGALGIMNDDGWVSKERTISRPWQTETGKETIHAWECVEGCPVAEVDAQSGDTSSTRIGNPQEPTRGNPGMFGLGASAGVGHDYRDSGGVSRYFKQVQETSMNNIPQDLVEYLCNMIGTPEEPGVYWDSLTDERFEGVEDNTYPGLLVEGTPTEHQAKELMRVLVPGAHLLLIAPDEEPTGHTGACLIEDTGFEIRDAILWVREAGKLHYVPKAARSEREAGCGQLKGKAGYEAVERQEGSAGVNNPRAGAGRTASTVKNAHPTVKPVGTMERLLANVPKDAGPVLDPFMGSGTTGIACVNTGHDFIGIEREAEYLEIADARIRHWVQVKQQDPRHMLEQIDVESDHKPAKKEGQGDLGLLDGLF